MLNTSASIEDARAHKESCSATSIAGEVAPNLLSFSQIDPATNFSAPALRLANNAKQIGVALENSLKRILGDAAPSIEIVSSSLDGNCCDFKALNGVVDGAPEKLIFFIDPQKIIDVNPDRPNIAALGILCHLVASCLVAKLKFAQSNLDDRLLSALEKEMLPDKSASLNIKKFIQDVAADSIAFELLLSLRQNLSSKVVLRTIFYHNYLIRSHSGGEGSNEVAANFRHTNFTAKILNYEHSGFDLPKKYRPFFETELKSAQIESRCKLERTSALYGCDAILSTFADLADRIGRTSICNATQLPEELLKFKRKLWEYARLEIMPARLGSALATLDVDEQREPEVIKFINHYFPGRGVICNEFLGSFADQTKFSGLNEIERIALAANIISARQRELDPLPNICDSVDFSYCHNLRENLRDRNQKTGKDLIFTKEDFQQSEYFNHSIANLDADYSEWAAKTSQVILNMIQAGSALSDIMIYLGSERQKLELLQNPPRERMANESIGDWLKSAPSQEFGQLKISANQLDRLLEGMPGKRGEIVHELLHICAQRFDSEFQRKSPQIELAVPLIEGGFMKVGAINLTPSITELSGRKTARVITHQAGDFDIGSDMSRGALQARELEGRIKLSREADTEKDKIFHFSAAMYIYFNCMPYNRGSASIGRSLFSALAADTFNKKIVIHPEIDLHAFCLEFTEQFVPFVEHTFGF